MPHPLDRPIFTALGTRHAALAEGGDLARRYPPDVSPFAASRDDAPDSLAALARLLRPGETQILLQADPIRLPADLAATTTADAVQMVAMRPFAPVDDSEIMPLGPDDAAEMLELALLTKPGPFSLRSQELGRFWGIRRNGRLVAMAGERLKAPGHTELSGLCTHPEFRGEGLGRRMLLHVAGRISAAGEVPFLHAYASNTSAIALYERIGFALRSPMHVAVIGRA
ncbi:GNAT family N-acetyltransferase [Methylobrevis pamukkalensis]|uniref:GNAT family N-acetyltransferase n=1 Tax=Methylobrevis pamukkalensis TaxID=1439726 RepID=UPI000845FCEB|nr:GNAT family N-acetyltransferase [Methylobrevis pamukkalensis]